MRLGVDEAGKGPVLGSMFAAAVRVDPEDLPDGVADSKALAPERRRELARTIRDVADAVGVAEIPVARIDDPGTDMNALTVAAHAEALAAAAEEGDEVYADAGDTNAVRFERNVADAVPVALDVRAEHGADETYPAVSAASILAKVKRDAHVESLAAEYGEVGSGYPGDEQTRTFLREFVAEHGELPECARESWRTSRDVLAAAEQSSLGEF
ncbi:MAG: ribonuclease HII [Halobacteriales archaeon SW_9_67_25]|jgi:ribonuclease HII|nr:MAG: ribonuclease HII [Halobacteriales archaeon SW_9_67_25]